MSSNGCELALPQILSTLPSELHVNLLSDQSLFVRASLNGVVREAVIAAVLTALMILLFLGSWRTTLIVALSIPLAILCSIITLGALGQTINVMTLGGLALAVGILVDDATVAIENIHRNAQLGKPLLEAILDGAQEIAVPTFVSTLSICVVFVPVFFLSGAAGSLFAPLAMAVIFAMMASYIISRTLVPTLVRFAMEREHGRAQPAWLERITTGFERRFDAFKARYAALLERALANRRSVALGFAALVVFSALLVPVIGRGLLSGGRRRTDSPASARACRERGWSRRSRSWRRWRRPCARCCRRTRSRPSSTTSALPRAERTWRSATTRRSARATPSC